MCVVTLKNLSLPSLINLLPGFFACIVQVGVPESNLSDIDKNVNTCE